VGGFVVHIAQALRNGFASRNCTIAVGSVHEVGLDEGAANAALPWQALRFCLAGGDCTSRIESPLWLELMLPSASAKPAKPLVERWWMKCCTQAKLALPFGGVRDLGERRFHHRVELRIGSLCCSKLSLLLLVPHVRTLEQWH
jgi:hypothetical protein